MSSGSRSKRDASNRIRAAFARENLSRTSPLMFVEVNAAVKTKPRKAASLPATYLTHSWAVSVRMWICQQLETLRSARSARTAFYSPARLVTFPWNQWARLFCSQAPRRGAQSDSSIIRRAFVSFSNCWELMDDENPSNNNDTKPELTDVLTFQHSLKKKILSKKDSSKYPLELNVHFRCWQKHEINRGIKRNKTQPHFEPTVFILGSLNDVRNLKIIQTHNLYSTIIFQIVHVVRLHP